MIASYCRMITDNNSFGRLRSAKTVQFHREERPVEGVGGRNASGVRYLVKILRYQMVAQGIGFIVLRVCKRYIC